VTLYDDTQIDRSARLLGPSGSEPLVRVTIRISRDSK